jgi:hypothetical protein
VNLHNDFLYPDHNPLSERIEEFTLEVGNKLEIHLSPEAIELGASTPYESSTEMLFCIMVESTRMYVESLVAKYQGDPSFDDEGKVIRTLAEIHADQHLLDDPTLLGNEQAPFILHLNQTLQALFENLDRS